MDIVFAIGDSYSQHCCVAIASILYNNPSQKFNFHILSDYLSEESKRNLDGLHGSGNYNIFFHTITQKDFESFNVVIPHTSIHTYYRYVIPEILPEVQKCLYLDSDIVVNGPLDAIWETRLEDNYIAGVIDPGISDEYKVCIGVENYPYINAGVILMDLQKMREMGVTEELFRITPALIEKGKYQDQDAINYVFRDKILILPSIWNYTKADSLIRPELRKDTVIIHYTEDRKPWMPNYYSRHAMRKLYFKYLKMTPYASFASKFWPRRILHRITKPFEPLFKPARNGRAK